ncbi:MAG: hypothetical protein GY896_15720, partial [Gammaproteobacteria bacterium]|nr:hypothetical protein [Gammaproteobacteria bacterium]
IENQATDINNDGDTDDIVFVSYDVSTGLISDYLSTPVFNLSNISSFPAKDGDSYFFRARETQMGIDADGDGNVSQTTMIMRMNLIDGSLNWTGISGTSGRIQARGDYITYDTSEWTIGEDIDGDGNLQNDFLYAVHNLADGSTQYLEKTGLVSLGSGVFSRTLYEGGRGDLNNDGDTTDVIVYAQALVQNEIIDIHNCDAVDIHCRFLNLIDHLSNRADLTQAMKALLIPLVEIADDTLEQGVYNNELEKYIAVIDAFDIYFDTIWPQAEIAHETKMDLVEYHQNGRALKDDIHDLKDQAAAQLEADEQNSGNDSDGPDVQLLIAGMAVAIQGSSAPQATRTVMMAEVNGIITIAQQIMGGADAGALIGNLVSHIQTMRDLLVDPATGFSVADIDGISSAIDSFEVLLAG